MASTRPCPQNALNAFTGCSIIVQQVAKAFSSYSIFIQLVFGITKMRQMRLTAVQLLFNGCPNGGESVQFVFDFYSYLRYVLVQNLFILRSKSP